MATTTKARRKTAVVRRLTEYQRWKEIATYISLCFMAMTEPGQDKPDYREIANRTQLSLATIYKMKSGNFSLDMRVRTLQALAYATGFALQLTKTSARMYVVD